jgi:hypothetical protein
MKDRKPFTTAQHRAIAVRLLRIQEEIAELSDQLQTEAGWAIDRRAQAGFLRMGGAAWELRHALALEALALEATEGIYQIPDSSPAAHHYYEAPQRRSPSLSDWRLNPYDMRLPWVSQEQLETAYYGHLLSGGKILGKVTRDSPIGLRRAAERLGLWFRREFHFDLPPYRASDEEDYAIFLWADTDQETSGRVPAIGAVGFQVDDELASKPWTLSWAWFHPYARRRGHLSRAWPYFRERFGEFDLELPLSDAMESFLHHNDPDALARTQRACEEEEETP